MSSIADLVATSTISERRQVGQLRSGVVGGLILTGLLEHEELEGLAYTEAVFLVASVRNDLENARAALARLAELHDQAGTGALADIHPLRPAADLIGPERSEGPYVARSTLSLDDTQQHVSPDTLHTLPANKRNFMLEADGVAPEGGPGLAGSER